MFPIQPKFSIFHDLQGFPEDSWVDKRELMKMEGIWSPQLMFGQICQDANDHRPICFRLIHKFVPPSKHGNIEYDSVSEGGVSQTDSCF